MSARGLVHAAREIGQRLDAGDPVEALAPLIDAAWRELDGFWEQEAILEGLAALILRDPGPASRTGGICGP